MSLKEIVTEPFILWKRDALFQKRWQENLYALAALNLTNAM